MLPSWSFSLVTVAPSVILEDGVWACSLLPLYRAHLVLQQQQQQYLTLVEESAYPAIEGQVLDVAESPDIVVLRLAFLALECCFEQ